MPIRFSQWASRSRRKKTTITITHETLSRLKQLSAQAGFEGESYDMMLEYHLRRLKSLKMPSKHYESSL
ncbi:hypothetical protein P4S73_02790 [Paraglaciecola sp. Hal342]